MTWTGGRREGWVARKPIVTRRATSTASAATSQPAPASPPPAPVVVPAFPSFSPASVAQLLGVHRSNVQYWRTAGKLECYRDNIGEPYILRAELIRFIREYLQRPVIERPGP